MGFFGRDTSRRCPTCDAELPKGTTRDHWLQHIELITPEEAHANGQPEAGGQYTWRCACGPANMKWADQFAAVSGLALHMMQRHAIALFS